MLLVQSVVVILVQQKQTCVLNDSPSAGTYTSATGMTAVQGEALGDSGTNAFSEMTFSIEKHTVTVLQEQ